MSNRTVDTDALDEIFDIESDANFFEEDTSTDGDILESIELVTTEGTETESDAEYVDTNLKDMVSEVKDMISAAKYLVNSSPDEHTIMAASTLFGSAGSLLKELNKGVLQTRKERHNLELEKMKIAARHELAVFKNKSNPAIGSGNTINIDNRQQQIHYSQESIVKEIIKANKAAAIETVVDIEAENID